MSFSLIPISLLGLLRIAASTFVAGWVSSPMAWSPDGEWLSYTVVTNDAPDRFPPGWIFRTSDGDLKPTGFQPRSAPAIDDHRTTYRIWATHVRDQASVLIEESHWPLTAPAWSPRGKSIAFGRFVPQSIELAQPTQKGRFELVIQDSLDRKQIAWSSAELELDVQTLAGLTQLNCCWSADGIFVAIPRPGPFPAVEIFRTDTKKRVQVIERSAHPSWSPDGKRCAFIRYESGSYSLQYVERVGQRFSDPRVIAASGVVSVNPRWANDSRSIYAVSERRTSGSLDLEITRFGLEPSESVRLMSLTPDPLRRRLPIRGLAIDFDGEAERCFFSVDIPGRDCELVWSVPREHVTHKRFHPLDMSQRIMAVAVSPDGQLVAARFGSPHGLTPPVVYDSETEQTVLVVPDDAARKDWLRFLATTASRILKVTLPPAVVHDQALVRPTLLPLPGELRLAETTTARVAKLAKFGTSLCQRSENLTRDLADASTSAFDVEARLFFNYLLGDFHEATTALESLEALTYPPAQRLGLLSVRAQLLWMRGEKSEAQGVIDYLVACQGPDRWLVEETPLGPVLTKSNNPGEAWARYLSARLVARIQPKSTTEGELPTDVLDPRPQPAPPAPDVPIIERRPAAPMPFAPERPIRPRG